MYVTFVARPSLIISLKLSRRKSLEELDLKRHSWAATGAAAAHLIPLTSANYKLGK